MTTKNQWPCGKSVLLRLRALLVLSLDAAGTTDGGTDVSDSKNGRLMEGSHHQ